MALKDLFAPGGGDLRAADLGDVTSGDFTPGRGLSIATRTNDIATTVEGWHSSDGSIAFDDTGAIGYGGAGDYYGEPDPMFEAITAGGGGWGSLGDDGASMPPYVPSGSAMSNLTGTGSDVPRNWGGGGGSSSPSMSRDSAMLGSNPVLLVALLFAAVWAGVTIYRTWRGHDGTVRIGATFFLVEVPIIVGAIWIWRYLAGVAVSHQVPGSAAAATYFAA